MISVIVLPMLIPAEKMLGCPLQILAGAALFMALFLLAFREKKGTACQIHLQIKGSGAA